ncbi:threonine/serine exporter family protein [bacterium]|jgi:uncharacterized membrane protein YjjP (DUF1212 family)|nr:threonine/serine exporter family protein [bacterium]
MNNQRQSVDTSLLLEFMLRMGQAYLACGEQTAKVELTLRRVATAYGIRRSRVVAFPTVVYVSIHDGDKEHVTFVEGPTQSLRLDQIADIYTLGEQAVRGSIPLEDGQRQFAKILRTKSRFGIAGDVLGNILLSVGVTMLLGPTAKNIGAAAVLGAVVGLLKGLDRRRQVLSVMLPVVAAAMVSTLVFLAIKQGLPIDPVHVLVPPLIAFLPGAMLTLGMVELAYGDMVSGSSRLITGFVQLGLLALGLVAGAIAVGYSPANVVEADLQAIDSSTWIPWAGVVVFGMGAYLYFSAPRKSFFWMLFVLLVTFGTQHLASGVFGSAGSGFFGMLVATPLAYLIQLRFHGPPAMVTFLPSFWLLVPGSLGLVSVTQMLSDRDKGIDGIVTALFVFMSIALGTLVGASLYKWLTETFGWWQLQLGRVGRYFRPKD